MRPRLLLAGLVMGAAITAGCGVLLDLSHLDDGTSSGGTGGFGGMIPQMSSASGTGGREDTTVTSATTGSASATTGDSSASSTSSASGTGGGMVDAGPPGVEITGVDGGPNFYIDSTEVTNAQYAAFVKAFEADPAAQKQHVVCGWNQSVQPNTPTPNDAGPTMAAPECTSFNLAVEAVNHPTEPIRCIDWCDAAAYCYWAGGYMCRSNEGDASHPVEWKSACGGAANLKFPYGPTYVANRCVDSNVSNKPAKVATNPLCEGGYSGVFDMSGNVSEWLDCGCEFEGTDPTTTNAYIGGGAYHATGDDLDCTPNNTTPIGGFRKDVGARCCYAVTP